MKKYLLGLVVLTSLFSFGTQKVSAAEELIITKICSPASCASTGASFSFILNDSNGIIGSSFTLNSSNNYTKTFPNFQNSQMSIAQQPTNIYTIIESTPSGWDAPLISCTPTNVLTPNTLSYASNSVTFDYTPNPMVPLAHILCTFTNTKQAVSNTGNAGVGDTEGKSASGPGSVAPAGIGTIQNDDSTRAVINTPIDITSQGDEVGISIKKLPQPAPKLKQPTTTEAPTSTDERLGKLNVKSTPAGINLISPTCFTVSSGICGTTNWTSTKSGGIPTTTYKYPTTATVGSINYILDSNSLNGCNQGTGGSPINECNVSVASGATTTISANYKKAPPLPVPACEVGAPNLVANPSFDLVKPDSGINIGGTRTWWYVKTQSTTNVINWTRDQSTEPVVTNWIQSTPNRLPFDGSKFLLLNPLGFGPFGVRGHLTTTPQIGVPYVLSARIQSVMWPVAGTVTMRLRNSGTGAQSDPVTGSASPQTNNWVLIGGTITPTAYYNQVILRYSQDGGMGLIDDVRLCKAKTSDLKKSLIDTPTTESLTPTSLSEKKGFWGSVWNWLFK